MKNLGKRALGLLVCLMLAGFLAQSALADNAWGQTQKGIPAENPHESFGPTYYGQPLALDDSPWVDPPRRRNKPDPDIPAIGSLAWWMQMAVDENPWADDPPKKGRPEPE